MQDKKKEDRKNRSICELRTVVTWYQENLQLYLTSKMYCPEIAQSCLVLVIANNIYVFVSLVPTAIMNNAGTIRNTAVVILTVTILLTAVQVIMNKKIEKWISLMCHTTRILSTLILFWATETKFMIYFSLSLSICCSAAMILDIHRRLHQNPKNRPNI